MNNKYDQLREDHHMIAKYLSMSKDGKFAEILTVEAGNLRTDLQQGLAN